nr:LLM class flavin-dependent oxidoreductase [Halorubellus salinus]
MSASTPSWSANTSRSPGSIEEIYPYTGSHESPFTSSHSCYELFTLLSLIAGRTETLTISPNVLVPAYRHPVELAKLVLTLQTLSGDRLELGVGAGWLDVEFDLLDVLERA